MDDGEKKIVIAWIDYREAFEMITHSWIMECLTNFNIYESVQRFVSESMKTWKVKLEFRSASHGEADRQEAGL